MSKHDKLREITARLGRVPVEEVRPDFSLTGFLSGSLNVHLLESAVREHLGVKPPSLHGLRTYAELEAAVLGSPVSTEATPPTEKAAAPAISPAWAPIACGLDAEKISSLPPAQDYWTHEFYRSTFTSAEIAYCARQATPLAHFAARWCAKEALKKCDPAYLGARMVDVQVHQAEDGAPLLQAVSTQKILPYALSMTHSDDIAAAVVMRLQNEPKTPQPQPTQPPAEVSSVKTSSGGQTVAIVLAVLSSIVATLALLRTWNW